ncbi:MAG: response regulator [Ferrimicrobium sp.]
MATDCSGATPDDERAAAIRVLIIEDHELVAVGLAFALTERGFCTKVHIGGDAEEVLRSYTGFAPDVVLLDLDLGDPDRSGTSLISPLKASGAVVIVVTGVVDRIWLGRAAREGADAIFGKGLPLADMVCTIKGCVAGRPPGLVAKAQLLKELREYESGASRVLEPFYRLTPREGDILAALAVGSSAKRIAVASYVSVGTVRSQIHSILQKLGVAAQREAVALAHDSGWLAMSPIERRAGSCCHIKQGLR